MSGRKILFGVAASWTLVFSRVACNFLVMPLYYAHLSRSLLGVWILFSSLGLFLSLSDLGLATTFSRALAFHLGRKRAGLGEEAADERILDFSEQDLLATVSRTYWLISLAVFSLGLAFGWLYLARLGLNPQELQAGRSAWAVYALYAGFSLATAAPNFALQGLGDVGLESAAQTVALWLGLLGSAFLLARGGGLQALAWLLLAQAVAVRWVLWYLLKKRHAWLFKKPGRFRREALKILLQDSLGMIVTRLAALFIFQINPILIASALGPGALPDYNVLFMLSYGGMQVSGALPQALVPFAAARKAAGDLEGFRRMQQLCVKASMSLQLVYAAFVWVFAPQLVELWVGPGHFIGRLPLAALLGMYTLELHHVVHAQFSWSYGRWPFARWALAGGLLNTLFVWWGVRLGGLAGAAGGTLLAQLLTNNWYVVFFTLRLLGIRLRAYLVRVALPLLGLLAALLAGGWLLKTGLRALPWPALAFHGRSMALAATSLLGGLGLALAGMAMAWFGVLNPPERQAMKLALRRGRPAEGL